MATKKSAPKKKRSATATEIAGSRTQQAQQGRRELWALLLFALAVLLIFLVFVKGKSAWTFMHNALFGISGICAYILPVFAFAAAVFCAIDRPRPNFGVRLAEGVGFVVLFQAAVDVFRTSELTLETYGEHLLAAYRAGVEIKGGGFFGALFGNLLFRAFGKVGAAVVVCLLLFILFMLITGTTLMRLLQALARPVKKIETQAQENYRAAKERQAEKAKEDPSKWDIPLDDEPPKKAEKGRKEAAEPLPEPEAEPHQKGLFEAEPPVEPETEPQPKALEEPPKAGDEAKANAEEEKPTEPAGESYSFPPLSLLKENKRPAGATSEKELHATAENLVDVLRSFGVETRVLDISRGPTVTRYELQPSAGVKISKITGLADDIALNLATAGVRIEAPIPNKAAVGIEVPNKANAMVGVREIIESPEFQNAKSKLTVAMGRDIAGKAVVADIAKMPHGLIAGSTGSGKSVCINTIIMSLLYRATPDEVKFLMIDPKVVELSIYNGIPHLLVPVVTDPRKAAGALGWAVQEMERRYRLFAENDVRNLEGYNHLADMSDDMVRMPQVVIIIDELADLMMTASKDVEDAICRIAQKARAAGMHLIIATQRPSVDVVTGLIKANVPSRIAFAVSSQTDSRTILDIGGAEKLLGKGDMLFCPVGANKPTRVQGCFVSDEEVESVVEFIKSHGDGESAYDNAVSDEIEKLAAAQNEKGQKGGDAADGEALDAMIEQAIECVVESGMASTSLLQRRLKLGYARAARIVDQLESLGVVGPYEGSKPRKVLMTKAQLLERQAGKE